MGNQAHKPISGLADKFMESMIIDYKHFESIKWSSNQFVYLSYD